MIMSNTYELHEKIEELLSAKEFKRLKELFLHENPVDIAETLDGFSEKEVSISFRLLSKEQAAEVFVAMESDTQEMLIASFSDKELKEIVDELYLDDTVDIVEEMPANVVARILKSTDMETRRVINEILLYPEDSAGSIMTPEYVSLRRNMTVGEAFDKIRTEGVDKETIYTCYVTENRKLVGIVSAKTLMLSDRNAMVGDIMTEDFIAVKTTDDKEYAASQIKKYGFLAIPVIDGEERLVGIVTVDDAIDVIESEATEDIEQMAAILPSEKPYLKTGIFRSWASRIPWLLLLMVSATFTSKILSAYESALAACVVLTAFIPMIMDTGGNAGGQASVTIIRGLSLGEIGIRDALRVVWKELRVSLLCGISLAPVVFLKVMYIDGLYAEPDGVTISLVVAATLLFVVVIAKLVGCLLPLAVKAVRLDPAVVANPFITTIVDALALMVYFALASRFIPALMAG
jgi:magnesium transporter